MEKKMFPSSYLFFVLFFLVLSPFSVYFYLCSSLVARVRTSSLANAFYCTPTVGRKTFSSVYVRLEKEKKRCATLTFIFLLFPPSPLSFHPLVYPPPPPPPPPLLPPCLSPPCSSSMQGGKAAGCWAGEQHWASCCHERGRRPQSLCTAL